MREPDHNALIGYSPADTYNHCQQVLAVLDMTTECQTGTGEDEAVGLHLILSTAIEEVKPGLAP